MSANVENTGALGRRLTVSVPQADINEKCRTKMAELAKQVRLKGFRPGKVPNHILEKRYGKSVRAEVIGEMIESSLHDALHENKLNPAGRPTIEDVKDETDQPLEYVATFEIFPEIELADLSDVSFEKKTAEIKESDIDNTIKKMCDNMGAWEKVDRAAQLQDKLIVDLERQWVEGDDQAQEKHEEIEFLLDPKQSLKAVVDMIVGKKAGETTEEEIAYPDDWHDESIRGKKAKFKVTVHEVQEKKPLNESELAEKFGLDADNKEGMREKVKERMEKEAEKVLHEETKESLLEILLDKNPLDKPKALLEQERKALKEDLEQKAQGNAQQMPTDEELDEMSEKRVALGLLMNEVIKKHDIKVNNQRVREYIGEQAANFPDPKRFINYYYSNKELLQGVERLVLLDQAVEAVLETMKVEEKPISYDEVMNPPESE